MEKIFFGAIEDQKIDVIKKCITSDTNIVHRKRAYDVSSPLIPAVRNGNFDIVKTLVSHGADVNFKTCSGWTPLHMAADYNLDKIFFYLLAAGADINIKNDEGKTPLDIMKENLEKTQRKEKGGTCGQRKKARGILEGRKMLWK